MSTVDRVCRKLDTWSFTHMCIITAPVSISPVQVDRGSPECPLIDVAPTSPQVVPSLWV